MLDPHNISTPRHFFFVDLDALCFSASVEEMGFFAIYGSYPLASPGSVPMARPYDSMMDTLFLNVSR